MPLMDQDNLDRFVSAVKRLYKKHNLAISCDDFAAGLNIVENNKDYEETLENAFVSDECLCEEIDED